MKSIKADPQYTLYWTEKMMYMIAPLYLGGAPYPVFEFVIVLTIITFGSSIYLGMNFQAEPVDPTAENTEGTEEKPL